MVVRLDKMDNHVLAGDSLLSVTSQGQASPDTRRPASEKPLQEQIVQEEAEAESSAATAATTAATTAAAASTEADEEEDEGWDAATGLCSGVEPLPLRDCGASSVASGSWSVLTDVSFDEDCESPRKGRQRKGRDRSNTWSHSAMRLKASKRSGSLPPMEGVLSPAVSRLSIDRGDSPFPSTPSGLSSPRLNRLMVCSEHRMSTSPRLPPIGGGLAELHSPRTLPKNSPKELQRDVTFISPELVNGSDTTDVRMRGRRRNAFTALPKYTEDNES